MLRYQLGIVGLSVMGRGLAFNLAEHGFSVAGYNLEPELTASFESECHDSGSSVLGCASYETLCAALEHPRKVLLMVLAEAPVDAVLDGLLPYLDLGDVIIDGGNSYYSDTQTRQTRCEACGIYFLGLGVSGGADGTRVGPALEKISLSDLCARYGVSSTPIKQALNRLIAEGLVESIPRKGCRVRAFSWSDADELFELRLMMELYFAPQATAAIQASSVLRSRFEQNIKDNLVLVHSFSTADEYCTTYEMDQQFHELLMIAGGNRAALRFYKSLNSHSYAAYLFGKQPRTQTINGILEHQSIFEAMLNGDVPSVCSQIESHIQNARKKISLFLKMRETAP